MDKERNAHQIVRKDAKGCFVTGYNTIMIVPPFLHIT